jgi:hypothetical protein
MKVLGLHILLRLVGVAVGVAVTVAGTVGVGVGVDVMVGAALGVFDAADDFLPAGGGLSRGDATEGRGKVAIRVTEREPARVNVARPFMGRRSFGRVRVAAASIRELGVSIEMPFLSECGPWPRLTRRSQHVHALRPERLSVTVKILTVATG